MAALLAGIGKVKVTPRIGAKMVGYSNRPKGAEGVHDDLYARAVVLDNGETTIALCSVEILWLWSKYIAEIRHLVHERCGLPEDQILIACTHTHASAGPHNTDDWEHPPLPQRIADAIVMAYEARQPARLGLGFGQLIGYNINRRWLNRPSDPSVGVMRIDTAEGQPLAVIGNYACHAVVMGYDNYLLSGDWPGYASRLLEADLGENTVALVTQGGAGDVNPLTETVRQRLAAAHPIGTIGHLTSYYGQYDPDDKSTWNIEDRAGGTFIEAETIARAYKTEIARVWHSIQTDDKINLWHDKVIVNGVRDASEPAPQGLPPEYREFLQEIKEDYIPVEIMLVGINGAIFMTQPGEVFSETAVEFRKLAQQMGYQFPWLISYANGSYAYLPPENAFTEGGYEVQWALRYGLSRHLQNRIAEAAYPLLEKHRP